MHSESIIAKLSGRCGALLVAVCVLGNGAQAQAEKQVYAINESTVTFQVQSNIRALRVHGETSSGRGTVTIEQPGDNRTVFENFHFSVPVKSIKTGMSLRDDHMYKTVFQAEKGEFPDIQFTSAVHSCEVSAEKPKCVARGTLTIGGKTRDQPISILISKEGRRYRATGEVSISLAHFNIDRPTQFGVTLQDDVRITVDMMTRKIL